MTEEDAGQRSLTSRVIESFKARTSPLLKSIVSPRLDSPTILMAANEGRIPSDPACPRSREVTMLHHQSSDPITKHCPSSPPDNNMTTIIHHNVDACVECGSREARCPHRLQSVPTRNRVTSHNEERSPESPHHRGKKMVEAAAIAGATVGIAEAVHHMVEAKKESTGEAAGRKQSPFHRHRDSHSPTGHDEHSHRASLMASGAAAAALAEGVHKIRESRKERDKCRSSSSSSSRSEEEKKRKRSHRLRKAAIATGAGLVGLMSAENMHSHSHSHSRTRKHDKCKPEISCRPLVASTCLGGQRTTTRPSTPCRCERSVTPPRFKGAPAGCDGMLTKHRRVHTSSAVECKPLHSAESPSIEHPVRDAAIVGGGTLLALEMARKITASQSPAHKIHPSPHHHLNSLLTHSEVFELLKGVTSPVTCEDVKVLQNRMQRASELQQEAEHRIQADRNALESIEEALVQIQREESRLQWKSDETEKRMTTLEALHHHRGQESISLLRNEAKRLRSLISEIERKVAHEESEEKKRCAEEFGQMKHLTSRDKELIIAALVSPPTTPLNRCVQPAAIHTVFCDSIFVHF